MSYFVTGATGFIGRNLVEQLLDARGDDLRAGPRGIARPPRGAEEPLGRRGGPHRPRESATSPRSSSAAASRSTSCRGKIDHFFHLAAIYDMTADAESQRVANVEGTREAVKLAEALDAKHFHMVSSIAAAGLYKGTFTEDMFDEAEKVDNHPYFQTKHESEAVVREECERPLARLPARDRRRALRDRRDGQDRRALLLLQAPAAGAQRTAPMVPRGRDRGPQDQHRPGRLRRQGDGPHRPHRRASTARPSTSPTRTR